MRLPCHRIGLVSASPVQHQLVTILIEFSSSLGARRYETRAPPISFAPFRNYEVVGLILSKMDRQLYQLGDPVTISIPVRDGNQPVREAQVEAVVSYQQNIVVGGEAARLTLRDASGTGMYSGVFTPPKPSQYNVTVTISGRTQRETGGFFVVPLHARLLSATLSFPETHPQARIRFQIFSAGQYRVAPTIRGGNGKIDNAAVSVDLTPGEHVVTWEPNAQEPQVLDMAPP